MADNALEQQARSYVDSFNSQRGIQWKDISRHFAGGGDADSLARWISEKYNLPLDEAKKYSMANAVLFDQRTDMGGRRLSQNENVAKMLGDLTPPGQEAPQQDPNEAERQNLTKWMTEFTQSLGRPLDMNDPVFASLSKLGAARASMGVGQSGIRVGRGGIGELGIQQGAMNAAMPYAQQRQQMYQQGLGMLQGAAVSNEQLRQGKYGLNLQQAQMQNQANAQMYGQQADSAGGVGGAVGGFLGALGTAGLAAIPGVGPAIATAAGPGLIKGGSSIGAGMGMNSVQRPTYSAPRPYGSFGRGSGY